MSLLNQLKTLIEELPLIAAFAAAVWWYEAESMDEPRPAISSMAGSDVVQWLSHRRRSKLNVRAAKLAAISALCGWITVVVWS